MQNTIKKCLSVLLACLMIMSIATVAFAENGTLTVGTDSGKAGEDVDISVTLNAEGVTSGVFKIRYDANVLTYKSADTATFGAYTIDAETAGTIKFAFANNDTAVAANAPLITVTFTIKAETAAGTYSNAVSAELEEADAGHHLKADGFFNANGEKVAVDITAGSVTVEATTYTVTYDAATNGGTTTATAETVAKGGSADLNKTATKDGYDFVGWNTDSSATTALESYTVNGDVTLYAIFAESATTIKYGDVNNDGSITADDYILLARVVGKWRGYTTNSINADAADVNCDGAITADDYIILARYVGRWRGYSALPYLK